MDSISREMALKALEEISYSLWEIDIPSPTVPEYIEHHEQVQGVMKLVDGWARKIQADMPVPAAEHLELDEWCTDCKEYDQEKHCCPRFNRVIRETLTEIEEQKTGKWILCSERSPKHDEYYETFNVTMQCKHVDGWPDYGVCVADWTPHGWNTWGEPIGAIKVVAWMPLPEPYRGETE